MVLTGGFKSLTTVSLYDKKGWREDFSSGLKTGRYGHGCTSFLSRENERVKYICNLGLLTVYIGASQTIID